MGATEESPPTSLLSEGSAPGAHQEPPGDPGAHHHLPSGHSGTHSPRFGLKSFLLLSFGVSFPSSPHIPPHWSPLLPCPVSSFPSDFVPFAYSPIIRVFSTFLSSTFHGKGTVEDQRDVVCRHCFQRACYLVGRESVLSARRGSLIRYM